MATASERPLVIKTRVFELCHGRYQSLCELANAMRISVSQVYRVREGKRSINQKFIVGAMRAFPENNIDDLFYLDDAEHRERASRTNGRNRGNGRERV